MKELIFEKKDFCYQTTIDLGGDDAVMQLDTGSPITTISVPNLLQITGEPLFTFRRKAKVFLDIHNPLSLGVYGSQINEVRHQFLPYLIRRIKIGKSEFPFFLFWVDITHLESREILPTSILFGFDYIKQGKKKFDQNDNFHILFDEFKADTFTVEYAMSNINNEINEISKLIR